MFDPISYWWHWVVSSTPLTGGWITVACLAVAIPTALKHSITKWKTDHEKIRRPAGSSQPDRQN